MKNNTLRKIKSIETRHMISSYGLPSRISKKRGFVDFKKESVSLKVELVQFGEVLMRNWRLFFMIFVVVGLYLSSYLIVRANYEVYIDEDGYYLSLPSGNRVDKMFLYIFLPLINTEYFFSVEHDGECESC